MQQPLARSIYEIYRKCAVLDWLTETPQQHVIYCLVRLKLFKFLVSDIYNEEKVIRYFKLEGYDRYSFLVAIPWLTRFGFIDKETGEINGIINDKYVVGVGYNANSLRSKDLYYSGMENDNFMVDATYLRRSKV